MSQGTPLLLAGDEFGNSQQGNNNAYAQDNEIGWLDWSGLDDEPLFVELARELIWLRRETRCCACRSMSTVHSSNRKAPFESTG